MEHVEKLYIQRYTNDGREDIEDVVIIEAPITIILNNQELVTLLCSPIDLKYLGVGYLFSEGLQRNERRCLQQLLKTRLMDELGGFCLTLLRAVAGVAGSRR